MIWERSNCKKSNYQKWSKSKYQKSHFQKSNYQKSNYQKQITKNQDYQWKKYDIREDFFLKHNLSASTLELRPKKIRISLFQKHLK